MILVMYATLLLNYMSFTMIEGVSMLINDFQRTLFTKFLIISVFSILILLTIIVTGFFLFHIGIIANGLSTIEFREKYGRKDHF